MKREWIMDVLADLRAFAHANNMPRLSSHLEEAGLLARLEIDDQARAALARKSAKAAEVSHADKPSGP